MHFIPCMQVGRGFLYACYMCHVYSTSDSQNLTYIQQFIIKHSYRGRNLNHKHRNNVTYCVHNACAWQKQRCVCPPFCVLCATEWQKIVMRPVTWVQMSHDRAAKLLRLLSCVQKPQVCLSTIDMNVFYGHAIIIAR